MKKKIVCGVFLGLLCAFAFVRSAAAQEAPSAKMPCVMALKPYWSTQWANACTVYIPFFPLGGGTEYLNAKGEIAPVFDHDKNRGESYDNFGFNLKDGYEGVIRERNNIKSGVNILLRLFGDSGKEILSNVTTPYHFMILSYGMSMWLPAGRIEWDSFSRSDLTVKPGWVQVEVQERDDDGNAAASITASFRFKKDGAVMQEFPVEAVFPSRDFNFSCLVDFSASSDCRVSLANPGTQIGTAKFTLKDEDGRTTEASIVLPPQELRAKMLGEMLSFPSDWTGKATVSIYADAPLLLYAVQSSTVTADDGAKSTALRTIYPPARIESGDDPAQ